MKPLRVAIYTILMMAVSAGMSAQSPATVTPREIPRHIIDQILALPRKPALTEGLTGGLDKLLSTKSLKSVPSGIPVRGDRILVRIQLRDNETIPRLLNELRATRYGDLWYASVTLSQLEELGVNRQIRRIEPQEEAIQDEPPPEKNTSADAAFRMHDQYIQLLHDAGIKGKNVRVGIIDIGFSALRAQRPAFVKGDFVCGSPAEVLSREGNQPGNHGSAVVEVLHKIAPEADIYIAEYDKSEQSLLCAAEGLAGQKVHIINASVQFEAGPRDGSDARDRHVDLHSSQNGILWINSAGNYGQQHFLGSATQDLVGFYWFLETPLRFLLLQTKSTHLSATVIWDDWDPDRMPIPMEAFLVEVDPTTLQFRARFPSESQVLAGRPVLKFETKSAISNQPYALALYSPPMQRRNPLSIRVLTNSDTRVIPSEPRGSIMIPATARTAIAVGAVNTDSRIAPYSSRGPADPSRGGSLWSGRSKPDISGYVGRTSDALGRPFPGTSAASPEVAGLAALIRQWKKDLDWAAFRTLVLEVAYRPPENDPFAYGVGISNARRIAELRGLKKEEAPPDFNTLQDLVQSGAARAFLTKVVLGRNPAEYRIGDGLKVGISSDRACHWALYHRNSQSTIALLDSGQLAAGATRVLEGFQISAPAGEEELFLVCSPLPWAQFDPNEASVSRVRFLVRE